MTNKNEGQRIVAFYDGSGFDDRGRSLQDILNFNDSQLEYIHDFIQWLFPLREPSQANPDAPCLDDTGIERFRQSPQLRENMLRALDRMLAFYGLARKGDDIIQTPQFADHAGWLTPGNHNHLRLTRMIKSLRLLGNEESALALFDRLSAIHDDERRRGFKNISDLTYVFWCDAAASNQDT